MKDFTIPALVLAVLIIAVGIAYSVYSDSGVSPYCPESEPADIDQKQIKKIFSPNQTSASFLVAYYRLETCKSSGDSDRLKRFSIVYDVYIKARSYAILNKVFFWTAIFFAVMVLLWPSLSVVFKEYGKDIKLLSSAIVQTTVTAIAALMFALYTHYKEMQMSTENLIRYAVYTKNDDVEAIAERVMKEMQRIDAGFSFSWISENNKPE